MARGTSRKHSAEISLVSLPEIRLCGRGQRLLAVSLARSSKGLESDLGEAARVAVAGSSCQGFRARWSREGKLHAGVAPAMAWPLISTGFGNRQPVMKGIFGSGRSSNAAIV